MKLRLPTVRLADCCWLPRIIDKARLARDGKLTGLYRLFFGSPLGMDGAFLRHFQLAATEFRLAVRNAPDDAHVGDWFLAQPGVNPPRIANWNEFAPRFGARGHHAYFTLLPMKWIFYPKARGQPLRSLFDLIELDER